MPHNDYIFNIHWIGKAFGSFWKPGQLSVIIWWWGFLLRFCQLTKFYDPCRHCIVLVSLDIQSLWSWSRKYPFFWPLCDMIACLGLTEEPCLPSQTRPGTRLRVNRAGLVMRAANRDRVTRCDGWPGLDDGWIFSSRGAHGQCRGKYWSEVASHGAPMSPVPPFLESQSHRQVISPAHGPALP